MNDGKLDLNELANRPDHQLTLVPRADPAERESRLKIEEADAQHRRRKDLVLHVAALVVVSVALGLCVWVIMNPDSNAEDKRWAGTVVTAIVTGLVGYVTGKSTK